MEMTTNDKYKGSKIIFMWLLLVYPFFAFAQNEINESDSLSLVFFDNFHGDSVCVMYNNEKYYSGILNNANDFVTGFADEPALFLRVGLSEDKNIIRIILYQNGNIVANALGEKIRLEDYKDPITLEYYISNNNIHSITIIQDGYNIKSIIE